MHIIFILPRPIRQPIGGYVVVYEYADRLAGKGHEVTVCHAIKNVHLKYKTPYWLRLIGHHILKSHQPSWFMFKNKVNLLLIPEVTDYYIPEGDVVIATWWATANPVKSLAENKGAKFYLVQGYEILGGNQDLIHHSYKLGLKIIVVTKWLEETLQGLGVQINAYIPNGLNFEVFKLIIPPEKRNPLSITMMYHEAEWKGSRDGITALEAVKDQYPDIAVTLFGVFRKPEWMPKWVKYIQSPQKDQLVSIYNNSAIFVSPSWSEGFGLPGAEALACGCALVTTDSGGVRDYATDQKTALISKPKEPESLCKNILRLVENIDLRLKLAYCGHAFIQDFTWENSVDKFEQILVNTFSSRLNKTRGKADGTVRG